MSRREATIEGMDWEEELPATVEVLRAIIRTAHVAGDFEFAINRADGWRMIADVFTKQWRLRIFGPNGFEAAQAVRLDSGLAGKVERWTMMRRLLSDKEARFWVDDAELILSEFLQGITRPRRAAWIDFTPR